MFTPLFKGATRPPTFFGIPLKPFFFVFMPIVVLAFLVKMWLCICAIPAYFIMREIVKKDDKYFTELGARFMLIKNSKKGVAKNAYAGLRSYSPLAIADNKHTKLNTHKEAQADIPLKNYIPYSHHVTPKIIKTTNNEYVATLELNGKAFQTVDEQDVLTWKNSLNNHIKTIASSLPEIGFYSHIVREKSAVDFNSDFKNDFCRELNTKYLKKFEQVYQNRLFLTILLKEGNSQEESVQSLNEVIEQLVSSLSGYSVNVLGTYTHCDKLFSRQLEFYAFLINKEWARIPVLNTHFNSYMALNKVLFSNTHGEIKTPLKSTIFAVLDIKEYDEYTNPEQLNEFLSVPFELTITQSFNCMPKRKSTELLRIQKQHLISAKDYANSQIEDLDEALDDIQSGRLVLGEHHCNIFIYGDNQSQVDKSCAQAKELLADMGFVPKLVSPSLECAYFASLPANILYRLRPAPITSQNFACFANFHNHFLGKADKNPWGQAVTLFETNNLTPVYFNFHEEMQQNQIGDKALGNTIIIGQSGSGKTVLANFMLSNLDKFNNTTVFFDKDKGAKIALLAMGGNYFDLKLGVKTAWNPLQLDSTPENIYFLNELIKTMLCHSSRKLSIQQINEIKMAIDTLFSLDKQYRTFNELIGNLPIMLPDDTGSRLLEWVKDGQYAWLFDNDIDTLDFNQNSIIGFDCTEFLEYPTIRTPLMMYMLHRMEQVIDGRRFVFFMDEFWKLLEDDVFMSFAKDKLKTIRKQNGFGVFMTQEPSDALNSEIGKTIIQQTCTQILLPNSKADENDYISGLKISMTEFNMLKEFDVSSRQFIIKKSHASSIAKLNLYGFKEINVLSGNTQNTNVVEGLIAQGLSTKEWLKKLYEVAV